MSGAPVTALAPAAPPAPTYQPAYATNQATIDAANAHYGSGLAQVAPLSSPFIQNGVAYQSNAAAGTGEDNIGAVPGTGYNVYGEGQTKPGDIYSKYGTDGSYQGDGVARKVDHNGLLAAGLLTAATMGAFMPGGFAAGAGGGVAGGLGNGAFLGEAAWAPTVGGGAMPGGFSALGGGMSGLGSGLADFGLGSITDAGIAGSPLTAGLGAASAPLPMGAGGWSAATGATGLGAGAAGMSAAGTAAASSPSWLSSLTNALPSGASSLLGPAASLLGGAAGAAGGGSGGSTQSRMDPRLDAPVFGDLVPRTQGLLGSASAQGQQVGADTMARGAGLQGTQVAGNGFGQVQLGAPTTATNPYLTGMADDMQRRTQELLGKNNLAIQGNAVGVGGLGGSRQGVAQGSAAAGAADSLQGQLAGLYGNAYNSDQNRALQKYGQDQGFYTSQRGQDLATVGMGTDLINQGQQQQWAPIKSAASVYAPFTGTNTSTSTTQPSGGWQAGLGGALGVAQLGSNFGWW